MTEVARTEWTEVRTSHLTLFDICCNSNFWQETKTETENREEQVMLQFAKHLFFIKIPHHC